MSFRKMESPNALTLAFFGAVYVVAIYLSGQMYASSLDFLNDQAALAKRKRSLALVVVPIFLIFVFILALGVAAIGTYLDLDFN